MGIQNNSNSTTSKKKGELFSFEVLIGIIIAMIVLLVLLTLYGVLKDSVAALPG